MLPDRFAQALADIYNLAVQRQRNKLEFAILLSLEKLFMPATVDTPHNPSFSSGTDRPPLVRRGIVYALVAVLLIVAGLAHFWDTLAVWRMHSRAAELSQASRDAEATDQLRAALLIDQDNPRTVLQLARAHRRLGELEPAMHLINAAQELGADPQQLELERTLLDVQTGHIRGFDQKLPQLMVDLPEQSPEILRAYVLGLFANLQIDEALQLLASWESSTPEDSQPKFLQAYVYQGINRLDIAAAAYRAGLKLSNDSTLMRRRLAQVLLEAGETEEAIAELKTCLKTAPEDIEVHYLLAQCAHRQNEMDNALAELETVLASSPSHFEARRLRGQILLDKGEPQAAIDDLQELTTTSPDDIVAREALARALQALGRTDEAKSHFEFVSAATKQQDETGRLIRQVLTEPQNVDLRFEIGMRLLQAGSVEDGAKWLRTVLEIQPDHADAHLALADVLERVGDYRNAAMHRQAATQLQ